MLNRKPESKLWDTKKIKDFTKENKITDITFNKFLDTWDGSGQIADEYNKYLQKATTSTSKFAASIKSIGANIGIMLAISIAIKAVSAVWDSANVTVAEVQESIEELSSSISTLQSEYDSLRAKDFSDLTESEKTRLTYLETRIAREKELLELEEARLIREKYGSEFTDFFDKDNYNAKIREFENKFFVKQNGLSGVYNTKYGLENNMQSIIDFGSSVDEYNNTIKAIEYLESFKTEDATELVTGYINDSILREEGNLKSIIDTLIKELQNYEQAKLEAEAEIEKISKDLENPNLTEDDKSTINNWIQRFKDSIFVSDFFIDLINSIFY